MRQGERAARQRPDQRRMGPGRIDAGRVVGAPQVVADISIDIGQVIRAVIVDLGAQIGGTGGIG